MAEIKETKEFALSKKLRANYVLTPTTSSPTSTPYHVDISSTSPTLRLLVDNSAVASARPYEEESHTFVIRTPLFKNQKLGEEEDEDEDKSTLAHLQRWGFQRGDMELNLRDGEIRKLTWKNRGVNGERFELLDITTHLETVLATFEVKGMLSRGGKMTIMVDWRVDFERVVVASLMCLFEKQSFWGKTYDPRGGQKPVPIPHWSKGSGPGGDEVNLGTIAIAGY